MSEIDESSPRESPSTADLILKVEGEKDRLWWELLQTVDQIRQNAAQHIATRYFPIARTIGRADPANSDRLGEERLLELARDIKSAAKAVAQNLVPVLNEEWIRQCCVPVQVADGSSKLEANLYRVRAYTCNESSHITQPPYPDYLKHTLSSAFEPLGEILRRASFNTGYTATTRFSNSETSGPVRSDGRQGIVAADSDTTLDQNASILDQFELSSDLVNQVNAIGEMAMAWYRKKREREELEIRRIQEQSDRLWTFLERLADEDFRET